jgi:hypothetical protein
VVRGWVQDRCSKLAMRALGVHRTIAEREHDRLTIARARKIAVLITIVLCGGRKYVGLA